MVSTRGRLGVGIVGLGMGFSHLKAWQNNPHIEIKGVCDLDEQLLESIAKKFQTGKMTKNYKDLLKEKDIDIISICTPDNLHAIQSIEALRAGKHVLCEKPMVRTMEECEWVVNEVERTAFKFMTGQEVRFTPLFLKMKDLIQRGDLGEVFFVEADYIHNMEKAGGKGNWRSDPKIRHPFLGGGCHPIDLLRYLQGDVKEVFAYANHKAASWRKTDDCIIATLKFQNGCVGKVLVTIGSKRPYAINCSVYGTKGTIIGSNVDQKAKLFLDKIQEAGQDFMKMPIKVATHAVSTEIDHFVDSIINDKQPLIDVYEGAKTVATSLAVIESAKTGNPIQVNNEF